MMFINPTPKLAGSIDNPNPMAYFYKFAYRSYLYLCPQMVILVDHQKIDRLSMEIVHGLHSILLSFSAAQFGLVQSGWQTSLAFDRCCQYDLIQISSRTSFVSLSLLAFALF